MESLRQTVTRHAVAAAGAAWMGPGMCCGLRVVLVVLHQAASDGWRWAPRAQACRLQEPTSSPPPHLRCGAHAGSAVGDGLHDWMLHVDHPQPQQRPSWPLSFDSAAANGITTLVMAARTALCLA